jgi:hypothetical protein
MNRNKTGRTCVQFISILFAGFLISGAAFGDVLETTDGKLIEGKFISGSQNNIRFEVEGNAQTFAIGDVLTITFENQPKAPAAKPPASKASAKPPAPAASEAPSPVTVPSGTRLMGRLDDTLDSRKHGAGHKFTVTLENNVIVNGTPLSTKGTKLYGRLAKAKKGGNLFGSSEFDLELTDFMIKGVPYPIVTTGVTAMTENATADTAKKTAAGAGIGAVAGGKKGARTGAVIGLGLSALTGSAINIPAGTLLEFSLTSDLTYVP